MFRRLAAWTTEKAGHRHAAWWMALFSFLESSCFPIPPDVLLAPMVLANPKRWLKLGLVCTVSSVAGGLLGYAIGAFAMDTVGHAILSALGLFEKFEALRPVVDRWGVWFILVKGATPIPYKVVTIAAGAFAFDPLKFVLASFVARGFRFLLLSWILQRWGAEAMAAAKGREAWIAGGAVLLVAGGFAALKLL